MISVLIVYTCMSNKVVLFLLCQHTKSWLNGIGVISAVLVKNVSILISVNYLNINIIETKRCIQRLKEQYPLL